MKKILYVTTIILLIGVMLISSYFIIENNMEDKEQERIFEEIQEIAQVEQENFQDFKNEEGAKENVQQKETNTTIDIESLYKTNSDMIGWLKIDNTSLNYPVMQTKDSPNYYLRKDFYKNYSQWGTPFLSESCDIETSDNLIIYGHHINNYKMFGMLEKYRNEKFYKSHKYIDFYTKEEKARYEIISVFLTEANTGFEYYNFISFENRKEFETFINKCCELSLYDIEEKTQYGDKFITLSTCDYSIDNGRLVVVAKKIL